MRIHFGMEKGSAPWDGLGYPNNISLPKSILTKRVDLGTFGENFQRSQNDHMTSLGQIEMFPRAFETLLHL